ncbi:zinc finger ZZ-type and EF-hand domain-containing protein 1-like [Gigantopelta aegis]|uniref:zinc finger ZZ-type and EF-hand domain-containing protein 1-like n=1 Tax=Gigantopelta aegis TaxID=1735272 RepID=UPI001B88E010|nr:zinc finger ZZ-type and EF-hand domain-containing protein 1-like [Gigantopelta aegis]
MGNSSSSDSEDEGHVDNKQVDDGFSDSDTEPADKEASPVTDLHALFSEPNVLRSVAAKIKEKIPENVIHQYHGHIMRWLRERPDRLEETVTLAQFCDLLMAKNVSRAEAIKAFQQFDTDGSGVAEVSSMLDALQSYTGGYMMGELGKNIRMLQACSLTPGFVDVYAGDKSPIFNHGERVIKYLLRNRAESSALPFPYLNGFNNTSNMRTSVLRSAFTSLKEAACDENEEQELAEGEELKPITRCFSSVEVSTNSSDAYRLTNGDPNTFWQSDGAARTHWIRLRMRNNVVLKQLSISVALSDQSYMPELVTVTAGRSPRTLRELKEVRISSPVTGDVILLKNVKVFYPIVQININRCRSDGCDTRIHGVKTLGYRVVKEAAMTVLDATAIWYLQILASTVSVTVPQSPQLRYSVLTHTRKALEHMPPLSLCPASKDRPQFLSKHVLQEMENFILELSNCDNNVLPEGLQLLLGLNLARGNVTGLLKTVKHFLANPDLSLPCTSVLSKMVEARNNCWEKQCSPLQLTLCGCDGGQSEESTSPDNVILKHVGTTFPMYLSEEGKTKVNMFFKSSETIQLIKLRIKAVSGSRGPRRGLVFVFRESKEFKLEEQVERFSYYDKWGEIEYKFSVQVRNSGIGGKPDNPVAYFTFDDDCDEIDIPVSWYPCGQYVLIKFLEPRQDSARHIGVVGIKFHGFQRKNAFVSDEILVEHPPNAEKHEKSTSLDIVKWVLTFLIDLSQDQVKKSKSKSDYLDYSEVELNMLWEIYNNFTDSPDEGWKQCSLSLLRLLHCFIPILSPLKESSKDVAESMFHHLCKLIDSPGIDPKSQAYRLAQQLIVDGASLFFPDKETKRQRLFTMVSNVDNLKTAASVSLVFQSLCHFFSSVDPRGLLDIPSSATQSFEPKNAIDVMQTLIVVASQEFELSLQSSEGSDQLVHLIRLMGSLQTSLLSWCWQQMLDDDEDLKTTAVETVVSYAVQVCEKAVQACQFLMKKKKHQIEKLIKNLQPTFLSSVVRQLVLILNFMGKQLGPGAQVTLLHNMKALLTELTDLAGLVPDQFPKINSENWGDMYADDITLRTWEIESPHNYDNSSHISQVFSCPGASKFIVDFDPRCETERRYDYLEFTDTKGMKMKLDQKVGSPKWPKQIVFSGPYLHFTFRSDSSNTEWGYKFKVTAKGCPDVPLSWPYDLQLGLCKLFGGLCGAVLSSNPIVPNSNLSSLDETGDQDILRSELWTSLFRGGYQTGKLQRTLSGKVFTDEAGTSLTFIMDIVNKDSPVAVQFIQKCQENQVKVPMFDSEEMDSAILSVFAALLWHTQQLREDIKKYFLAKGDMTIPEGIYQAYATADSLRLPLASQKQAQQTAEDGNTLPDDVNPVVICKEKATYLLKFAGLTKVQLKYEMRTKAHKNSFKKLGNKKSDKHFLKIDVAEKYPSFRLVMEFVQDPAWTTDRVDMMLGERTSYATGLADVYTFMTTLIRSLRVENPFQIPIVLFFQELLSYQDRFVSHYADGLDGCGLQQEGRVRLSYYTLIRTLAEVFQKFHHHEIEQQVVSAYDYIQACFLHLLDIQWQPYDLSFVADIKLPELFLSIAKETVKMRDCTVSQQEEDEELREYNQCMKWFEECGKGFSVWYERKEDASKEEKKALQMFVGRFCDLLDVEISCDGCGVTLPGRRYRCLNCMDMDLCTTCYCGGVKPEGEHRDDHDIVHLVYKCNKCQAFIVGTRIHCNECEDFDLCLGCHLKAKFPSGHLTSHDITKIPMVKLKTSEATDSLIQAYIHQHVWMLFSALSLSLGDIIYHSDSANSIDTDYLKLAAQLQNQCITLSTHCLQKVPADADDSRKCLLDKKSQTLESRQEEAFAIHSQERIMGLLGAMIPIDHKAQVTGISYNFTTEGFLKLLFTIARGDSDHELNTQHLAMGLLSRLLAKSSAAVADPCVKEVLHLPSSSVEKEGEATVKYLFSFGASCLERSGLEWACSMARILGTLSRSEQWKPVVSHHISTCIQSLRQKPELSSIFAMFVMAGFPEVLTIGTLVQYFHRTLETKTGVVMKHFPDKYITLVVDVCTRKRLTIKDQYVTCLNEAVEVWNTSHMSEFTSIIIDTVTKLRAGEEVGVESLWVLSLALKVVNNSVKSEESHHFTDGLFQPDFIQCLVFVASKATGFSQQWLLKDLEVLSLMLYTHDGASKKKKLNMPKSDKDVVEAKTVEKKASTSDSSCSSDSDDDDDDNNIGDDDLSLTSSDQSMPTDEDSELFGTIDDKTKNLFFALHHELNVPLSVLRVIFEMNEGDVQAVKKAILENFGNSTEIKNIIDKWSEGLEAKSSEKVVSSVSEKVIDTGIHFHPVLNRVSRTIDKAVSDTELSTENFIQLEDGIKGEISEKCRTKSAELLKRELQKHDQPDSRDYVAKVNMAMAILYARHLLTGLLACWPEDGHPINAVLLGCKEVRQIPCVLDLLYKTDSHDCFEKVVQKVIEHCDSNSLVPIACTACQFMEEVTLSAVSRESEHPHKLEPMEEKIQLTGAAFLTVSFDNKCAIEDYLSGLEFGTDESRTKNSHCFTGKNHWNSFQVPGDTLYYKFLVDPDESSASWGYKFMVTAGTRDSFETGHTILNAVLSSDVAGCLPLGDLWSSLVYVACKQMSLQRLKAIQLLLKIVLAQSRTKTQSTSEEPKLAIDLSLLKPLWIMYMSMTKDDEDPGTVLPPVVRALTEFFLQVENLVIEWDVVPDYIVAVHDKKEIMSVLIVGLKNIAAVSHMIGLDNAATSITNLFRPGELVRKDSGTPVDPV